ncbi:dTDP-4-dehydrorhamnose 3,5-epimerase-like enzyme [Hymenobacter luteus]|uniref:dTDP-4-dehydrorhamnose 3,5-epimerase-like enzyme n=2 Tax=Hymenobacter TaxID=89966 RepID=A0A7W9T0K2_9BACT|nr:MULTISPECIES: FdtA/QdtA family cupin domain-containing protein [Hymenobacter]MBB4600607.1 dTDP-4-dehydrorhamnose 3,5-epimerase-like enzyme [Hymenobacter latericoloratus]MBB6059186.1 dTDP-4-dehydrorhamnose 3,5-epimerase-like enzyme [Hymenobacter luteus]
MDNAAQQPRLIEFSRLGDTTIGYLTVAQNSGLPFTVQRVYWTYSVSDEVVRGHHAHKELEQIIFAVSGEIEFTLEDIWGKQTTYYLDKPNVGLYIPRLYWRTIKFSRDAVLLCLASLEYIEEEYIRDYVIFSQLKQMGSK